MCPLFPENWKSIPKFLSGKNLYKKCNPPDVKFYVSILTIQNFPPYGVLLILGQFSLLFCIVYCSEEDSKFTLHHMGILFYY